MEHRIRFGSIVYTVLVSLFKRYLDLIVTRLIPILALLSNQTRFVKRLARATFGCSTIQPKFLISE